VNKYIGLDKETLRAMWAESVTALNAASDPAVGEAVQAELSDLVTALREAEH
jgi:hypothetical protein